MLVILSNVTGNEVLLQLLTPIATLTLFGLFNFKRSAVSVNLESFQIGEGDNTQFLEIKGKKSGFTAWLMDIVGLQNRTFVFLMNRNEVVTNEGEHNITRLPVRDIHRADIKLNERRTIGIVFLLLILRLIQLLVGDTQYSYSDFWWSQSISFENLALLALCANLLYNHYGRKIIFWIGRFFLTASIISLVYTLFSLFSNKEFWYYYNDNELFWLTNYLAPLVLIGLSFALTGNGSGLNIVLSLHNRKVEINFQTMPQLSPEKTQQIREALESNLRAGSKYFNNYYKA